MSVLAYRAWHKKHQKMFRVLGWREDDDEQMVVWCKDERGLTFRFTDTINGEPGLTVLMQSLPFLDKTGATIYEGDIVATGVGEDYVRSVVRIGPARTEGSDSCWPEDYYGVYLDGSYGLMDILLKGEMYVVGNLYEQPALAGQKGGV